MKKILLLLQLLIVLCFSASPALSAGIEKQTYLYSVKGADSLYLDKYTSPAVNRVNSPCIAFMFGGGFFTGSRDGKSYIPYFEYMADNGYTVISIDYRLGFKNIADGQGDDPRSRSGGKIKMAKAFIALFRHTVDIAVEDLYDATNFILHHAAEWGIDPERLITNGSSAGAVTVLQAEYGICNGTKAASRLPAGFNYAGVVSFAGAILEEKRDINFRSAPCPIMLFHGDADSNVPYNRLRKLGMGLFGSKHIAKKLTRMNSPHIFYSIENADHVVAVSPMTDNRHDILSFLEKLVNKGEKLIIDADVDQTDVQNRKKRFGMADYIKSNFGQ